jgi:serine/threonine-protein kinase
MHLGRYEIVGQLGSGGMGSVFLGRTVGPGGFERLVALKTIHPHLSSHGLWVRMFLDEARLSAGIRHPNVVPVFEVGEDGGRYYLVMEYVSGEALHRLLTRLWRQQRQIPYELAAHIAFSISEGLHAAHELTDSHGTLLGVIHRDVSPKNILIGYDGVVRLFDFGVAKARDQLSHTGSSTRGTVAYMAPEQLDPEYPIDRRADVFALGIVLWELTVLRRLFLGRTDLFTAENVRNLPITRPSELRDDYPPELERVVMKALERDPDRRFATAREMGAALRDVLERQRRHVLQVDVEAFIKEMFGDRLELRLRMERAAALGMIDPTLLVAAEEDSRVARQPVVPVEPTEQALRADSGITDEPSGPLITRIIEPIADAARVPDVPDTTAVRAPPRNSPPRAWLLAIAIVVCAVSAFVAWAWETSSPLPAPVQKDTPAEATHPSIAAETESGPARTATASDTIAPSLIAPPPAPRKPVGSSHHRTTRAAKAKRPVLLDGTDL